MKETGEIDTVPRVVLFAKTAKATGVSVGIFKAVRKLLEVFGQPEDWMEPVKIKIKQQNIKERKMLTFEVMAG